MKRLLLAVTLLLFSLSVSAMDPFVFIPSPPTGPQYPVFRAVTSGPWNAPATWGAATAPSLNSVVTIPVNITVTIDQLESNNTRAPKWVRIEGTLAVSTAVSTRFYAETIHVAMGGTFLLGTAAAPLPLGRTAEIIFTSPAADFDKTWDPQQITRGLIADGSVKVYGISRTYAMAVTNDVPKNARSMNLLSVPSNWQPLDELVLTGTYFRRNAPPQDELRHFGSLSGTLLTIHSTDTAFQNDHLHVSTSGSLPNFHIANLTRNVMFKSDVASPNYRRGHVMLMNSDTQIQWASFINLGRTDKSTPLNDYTLDRTNGKTVKTPDANITNIRGRYPVHIHKAGYGPQPWDGSGGVLPQTNITGCVVVNTPGWAFVNHSSNVDFRRNVAYDFTGAGFVSEDGDEIGYFVNNIAIRGKGDPNAGYDKARINFANFSRPQPVADFGFNGDGFWFNGPALHVNGAIASGCNGRGVIWHTTGAVNIHTFDATLPYGHYTFFLKDNIPLVYGATASTLKPRTWKFDSLHKSVVIADLPVLACSNIESYGNFIGLHLRFNNFDDIAWYTEDPYNFDMQIDAAEGQTSISLVPTRLKETITGVQAWNDETAFALRYAGDADLTSFTAINRLDYDEVNAAQNPSLAPAYGVESFFNLRNIKFTGLITDGWDVANFFNNVQNSASVTGFDPGTPSPRNYALTGTWDKSGTAMACAALTPNTPIIGTGGTSVTLRWSGSAITYLVRYRIAGAQQWTYVQTNATSLVVPTTALQPYVWQVIGGCDTKHTITNYTAQGAFHT
jgi:hypothetical protein